MTATLTRRDVEYEITVTPPDRVSVAPGIEVEFLGPIARFAARHEALKIAGEIEAALHRPAFDSAAFDGDGDFRVLPGSNRHVRLALAAVGAVIELDQLDEADEDRELLALLGEDEVDL